MTNEQYPGLQVEEDLRVKQFSWIGQSVLYVALAIIIAFALLGGFGSGLLSEASAETGGMRVRYSRFERLLRPTVMRFEVAASGGRANLRLDKRALESWEVRAISPDPVHVSSDAEWVTYRFAAREHVSVVMRLVPERAGRQELRVSGPDGPLALSTFVYP